MRVSLVVLVMHLGTFPPTKLLSGIISTESLFRVSPNQVWNDEVAELSVK